jgi:hypothetical protein
MSKIVRNRTSFPPHQDKMQHAPKRQHRHSRSPDDQLITVGSSHWLVCARSAYLDLPAAAVSKEMEAPVPYGIGKRSVLPSAPDRIVTRRVIKGVTIKESCCPRDSNTWGAGLRSKGSAHE